MAQNKVMASELIAGFKYSSTPLEQYLQEFGPLSPLQLESLSRTIDGLQTFLAIWKAKDGEKDKIQ